MPLAVRALQVSLMGVMSSALGSAAGFFTLSSSDESDSTIKSTKPALIFFIAVSGEDINVTLSLQYVNS
jgi:hypothetical protein